MKLLLDFLPLVLFFAVFKYGDAHKDWAASFATEHLGFMVSGGVVGQAEAPVLLATVKATEAALAGEPLASVAHWLGLLVAADVVYVVAGLLTFDFVLES